MVQPTGRHVKKKLLPSETCRPTSRFLTGKHWDSGFLTQLSLSSRVTDRWAQTCHGADLTQEGLTSVVVASSE